MNNPKQAQAHRLAEAIIAENFARSGRQLVIGGVPVGELAAAYGTPLYVYDAEVMRQNYRRLSRAVSGFADVYFSMKANPNPDIVKLFVEEGAGVEIASGAEFRLAMQAGCAPDRILFAGPGKGAEELALTIKEGIHEIHVESLEEIAKISSIAHALDRTVPIAIRVNPISDVRGGAMQMGGRPSPFGFDEERIDTVLDIVKDQPLLDLIGVHLYPGTQILDTDTLLKQWAHALDVAGRVARSIGEPLRTIDLGGGLGIPYHGGDGVLDLETIAGRVPALRNTVQADEYIRDARIIIEPGRYLSGPGGVYLMSVRAVKTSRDSRFAITDGGMHHHLAASGNLGQVIKRDYPIVAAKWAGGEVLADCAVVGPLCTPLDTLGRNTQLPELASGDLIAVLQSGAYGLTASPTGFLSHPTPVEVLADNANHRAIRVVAPSTGFGLT